MKLMKNTNNFIMLPILILFFCIQVFIKPSELILTTLIIAFTITTFLIKKNKGEISLFSLGLVTGLIIEVALGLVSRQQHWDNASLLGVPYWLPLVWGYGFVMITRIGCMVRGIKE